MKPKKWWRARRGHVKRDPVHYPTHETSLLGSCAFPGETDPFRARQQWKVMGRDGEIRVEAVVGTGWLLESQSGTSEPPRPLGMQEPTHSVYSNKQIIFGALTTLLRSDTTPTLILDPKRHEGTVLWNAGQPGNIYGCSFSFNRGATRFGGELVKHVQTHDLTVGTCIIELKR